MKIRVALPLVVSALALLLLAVAGESAFEAVGRRAEAEAFVKANAAAQLLLTSAGEWAIERGLTNAAMKAQAAAPVGTRDDIATHRAVADAAFADALGRLGAIPEMRAGQQAIAGASRAMTQMRDLHAKIDVDRRGDQPAGALRRLRRRAGERQRADGRERRRGADHIDRRDRPQSP
jgi:methyl-accepting chemotaxis protein